MTSIPFDTLKFVRILRQAGFEEKQAEGIANALQTADRTLRQAGFEGKQSAEAQEQLVTKTDLEGALAPLRTDLVVLKWIMGVLLAGVLSLVLKVFF